MVGGTEPLVKDYVCPDGCVCFRMKATTGDQNFYKDGINSNNSYNA